MYFCLNGRDETEEPFTPPPLHYVDVVCGYRGGGEGVIYPSHNVVGGGGGDWRQEGKCRVGKVPGQCVKTGRKGMNIEMSEVGVRQESHDQE